MNFLISSMSYLGSLSFLCTQTFVNRMQFTNICFNLLIFYFIFCLVLLAKSSFYIVNKNEFLSLYLTMKTFNFSSVSVILTWVLMYCRRPLSNYTYIHLIFHILNYKQVLNYARCFFCNFLYDFPFFILSILGIILLPTCWSRLKSCINKFCLIVVYNLFKYCWILFANYFPFFLNPCFYLCHPNNLSLSYISTIIW